jgi:anti-sigma factor RsiW
MTCRDARTHLDREARGELAEADRDALTLHLDGCVRCGEAARVARLAPELLGALRQQHAPGPDFYPRLRRRMAEAGTRRYDEPALAVWGFARRLVPALAFGVVLLAGVTLSLSGPLSPQQGQVTQMTDLYAFSLDEVGLTGAVERPNQDQMLAFVLTRAPRQGAASGE